jgi:hypothetical protein
MTKAQQAVVDMMNLGWALCTASRMRSASRYAWLQKDGAGQGGETKTVRTNVVFNMFQDGIIEQDVGAGAFPTTVYKLTARYKKKG